MDRGIRTCSHWKRTLQHVPENSHLDAPSDTRKFFDVYYIFQDPIVDLKCMHRLPPHKGSSYSKLSTMSTKRTCRRANQSNDFVYQHHIE